MSAPDAGTVTGADDDDDGTGDGSSLLMEAGHGPCQSDARPWLRLVVKAGG